MLIRQDWEAARQKLVKDLDRQPTLREWANALDYGCPEGQFSTFMNILWEMDEARDLMISANLRLVLKVTQFHRGLPRADLIQEGTIGLVSFELTQLFAIGLPTTLP